MKKIFAKVVAAVILAPLFAAPLARAEDFYAGASYGPRTDGHVNVREGGEITRHDAVTHQRRIGIYAGYVLTPEWALETGYDGVGGSTDYQVPGGPLKLRTQVAYLAARRTLKLSEDWSLYGKAGVAQGRLQIDGGGAGAVAGAGAGRTVRKNGAYLGVGVAYAVSNNVSLQLELEHTHKITYQGLSASMDKISIGARLGF